MSAFYLQDTLDVAQEGCIRNYLQMSYKDKHKASWCSSYIVVVCLQIVSHIWHIHIIVWSSLYLKLNFGIV